MKKTVRTLTVLVMAVLMLTVSTIPAMAAGSDSETANNEITFNTEATDFINGAQAMLDSIMGNGENQQTNTQNEMSNIQKEMDESWQQFEEEIKKQQEEWAAKEEEFKKQKEEREQQWEQEQIEREKERKASQRAGIIIAVVAVLLLLAEITYIFITAPKCGMSRFWALVPLFSNFFGLLVFLVVRSSHKATARTNTFTCPVCNSIHPNGTAVCSICGNHF